MVFNVSDHGSLQRVIFKKRYVEAFALNNNLAQPPLRFKLHEYVKHLVGTRPYKPNWQVIVFK